MKGISTFLGPFSNKTESFLKTQPILFSLLILYQGLFSGNAIRIPKRLKALFDNGLFRFFSILLISYTATQDVEYALISTVIFLTVIYTLKTREEREKTGFV